MATNSNLDISKNIGLALAKYRKAAGLSQAKVAELMGLSNDAISRMERGTITLSVERLFEFAELFGCDPTDLLSINSTNVDSQSYYLANLLSKLESTDRAKLLHVIEQLVEWKLLKSKV